MAKIAPSPLIKQISWGQIEVEGRNVPFKDAKLFPGGSRAWDWRETGTDHSPGIQPADVEELLEHGATVVILSTGFNERLRVNPKTEQLLKDRNIPYHILQTEEAMQRYNSLREKEAVGGLFHTTC